MIKKIAIGLFLATLSVKAQINDKALENFNSSSFQNVTETALSDVTILFDRSYIDVKRSKSGGIEVYKTIHRKIKIHSLYGLENYNKLFIPTFNDINIALEFTGCKAKVLKENNKTVVTSSENIITTTLPANAPFFYKMKGKVKMLAIEDLNLGDELEYIYTTKQAYDFSDIYNFYKTDKIAYTTNDYCLEKSLFIHAKRLNVKIWPYNFKNGINPNTNFLKDEIYTVSLKNIKPSSEEIYSLQHLHEPYLFYEISSSQNKESDDTWKDFAKYFKPKRQLSRKASIFDGKSLNSIITELDSINGTKEKYQFLLRKINKPFEDNFGIYKEVKNDIGVAWSYAKVISEAAKKQELPINFNFVVSKENGTLDKSLVNLYQFDAIICSYKNEQGKTDFFPLVSPYSSLNDIKKEYQGAPCFSIKQDREGNRTYDFGSIPMLEKGNFEKRVHFKLNTIQSDTLKLTIKETLKFKGHIWLEFKADLYNLVKDSLMAKKRLKSFAKSQIVLDKKTDSIYNITYVKNKDAFTLSYQYDLSKHMKSNANYYSISPKYFFAQDFFTPYYQKNKRLNKGYLINEFSICYFFSFENENNSWLENKLLKNYLTNEFGSVSSTYGNTKNLVEASVKLDFIKEEFEPQQWRKILDLREAVYDFLNSKFYYKIKAIK